MMNDNTLSQDVITTQLNDIVEGLVCVCITWGRVPVIRSPPNCLAAEIGSRLHKSLQEMLRQPNNPFYSSSVASPQRPVMILFDRAIDLSVMLRHSFTYQPLVHDLLGMRKNRVSCDVVDEDKRENKTYDIAASDEFWRDNRWETFPAVAQHIQENVGEYQRAKEQLLSLGNAAQGNEGEYNPDAMLGRTQDIGSFMSKMPELTRTKKLLDMHTNIATALLREINERSVVDFFELEHQIVTDNSSSFSEKIKKLLSGSEEQTGAMIDKIRLMLIYFLSTPKINQSEFEAFENILASFAESASALPPPKPLPDGVDMGDCMAHFKKKKTFGMTSSLGSKGFSSSSSSGGGAAGLAFSQLTTFGNNILGSGIQKLSSGLGLNSNEYFCVTQLVASIMNGQPTPDTEPYLCLDPRSSSRPSSTSSSPYSKRPFQEGFVFMIGGGSFLELENLHKLGTNSGKKIMYGCTEMLSPEDFLKQATQVGRKAK